MSDRLIILDRDGVINEDSDAYIKSPAEWVAIPGSAQAIARLKKAGFQVWVATNQSGIGRGYYDEETLAAIHDKMHAAVKEAGGEIDGIVYCPHAPDDGCGCRKPRAGLVIQIEEALGRDVRGVPIVGDSLRDLECGLDRGCRPMLVRTGKGERTLEKGLPSRFTDTPVFDDLAACVDSLLEEA
jgi:D-glycero-D-manno-heptose 1,7-bisphosphate phosphatase